MIMIMIMIMTMMMMMMMIVMIKIIMIMISIMIIVMAMMMICHVFSLVFMNESQKTFFLPWESPSFLSKRTTYFSTLVFPL